MSRRRLVGGERQGEGKVLKILIHALVACPNKYMNIYERTYFNLLFLFLNVCHLGQASVDKKK